MKRPSKNELQLKLKGAPPEDVAEFFEVSRATVYRWIKHYGLDYNNRKGCYHHKSDLTIGQVMDIYNAKGEAQCKELAGLYGVSPSTISNIWNLKTHKDEIFNQLALRSQLDNRRSA